MRFIVWGVTSRPLISILSALQAYFDAAKGTLLGLFDMFAGGALSQFSIFALGIMPYISASIILELLTVVVPSLEKLSKEGEAGAKEDNAVHPLRDRCP